MQSKAILKITDLVWNAENQPEPGTPLTFTITLTNVGNRELVEGHQETSLTVWVNQKPLPLIRFDGGLDVGESKTFDCEPWEAVAGNHVITATVNFAVPSITNWNTGVIVVKNLRVGAEALPVPEPAAAVGMNTLTFSDDFRTLDTIDRNATGKIGYKWYSTSPYTTTPLPPDSYELTENGMLLRAEKRRPDSGYGLFMMDVDTSAGWGYNLGYMEARFRFPPLPTIEGAHPPSIWAIPPEKLWSQTNEWLEMDYLEYWGNKFSEDLLYTVTLHHQCCDYNTHQTTFWAKNNKTAYHYGLSDGDWHVMGWLWDEGRLTTYVDGKEIMTQRWSKDGNPEPACEFVKCAERTGAFSVGDNHIYPVIINGREGWPLEIDYLNVWQK